MQIDASELSACRSSAEVGAAIAAAVQRELDSWERTDRQVEEYLADDSANAPAVRPVSAGAQRSPGTSSVVFSVRLDRDELAALELRAAAMKMRPSVLARNLIRIGVRQPSREALSVAVDRLEAAMAEVRALVP